MEIRTKKMRLVVVVSIAVTAAAIVAAATIATGNPALGVLVLLVVSFVVLFGVTLAISLWRLLVELIQWITSGE